MTIDFFLLKFKLLIFDLDLKPIVRYNRKSCFGKIYMTRYLLADNEAQFCKDINCKLLSEGLLRLKEMTYGELRARHPLLEGALPEVSDNTVLRARKISLPFCKYHRGDIPPKPDRRPDACPLKNLKDL